MPRISEENRRRNEEAIRAAIDRLVGGQFPSGGRCDLKTLAEVAGVSRTGFYPKGERRGPYQHLAEEFERRLARMHEAGEIPDPREAQIAKLKEQVQEHCGRLQAQQAEIAELKAFQQAALSRIAAQHDEILRLRALAHERPDNVRALPARGPSPARRPRPM